tara:strand:+ start:175 stop:282 length:108 start_codon:yes stop_codon:yes gene_type:complete
MEKQYKCEKCGEIIDSDKEKTHKIFCYSWFAEEDN